MHKMTKNRRVWYTKRRKNMQDELIYENGMKNHKEYINARRARIEQHRPLRLQDIIFMTVHTA